MQTQMVHLVINKKAKRANQYKDYEKILKSYFHCKTSVLCPEKLADTIKTARANDEILLIGGGDGTIHHAIQILHDYQKAIGFLPLGTLNHFIREANLPQSPENMLLAIQKILTKQFNMIKVNNEFVINNACLGFYPNLVKTRNYFQKFMYKFIAYLPAIISQLFMTKILHLKLHYGEKEYLLNTSFLMLSNNRYNINFPFKIKRESFTQKEIGIYFLQQNLKKIVSKKSQHLFTIDSKKHTIIINSQHHETLKVGIDGEVKDFGLPIKCELADKNLELFCNENIAN
jgi:diacylglycerol kinase family enzyme